MQVSNPFLLNYPFVQKPSSFVLNFLVFLILILLLIISVETYFFYTSYVDTMDMFKALKELNDSTTLENVSLRKQLEKKVEPFNYGIYIKEFVGVLSTMINKTFSILLSPTFLTVTYYLGGLFLFHSTARYCVSFFNNLTFWDLLPAIDTLMVAYCPYYVQNTDSTWINCLLDICRSKGDGVKIVPPADILPEVTVDDLKAVADAAVAAFNERYK